MRRQKTRYPFSEIKKRPTDGTAMMYLRDLFSQRMQTKQPVTGIMVRYQQYPLPFITQCVTNDDLTGPRRRAISGCRPCQQPVDLSTTKRMVEFRAVCWKLNSPFCLRCHLVSSSESARIMSLVPRRSNKCAASPNEVRLIQTRFQERIADKGLEDLQEKNI